MLVSSRVHPSASCRMGMKRTQLSRHRISLCLRAIADAPAANYFDENIVLSETENSGFKACCNPGGSITCDTCSPLAAR
jgi:hypothetical protein